MATLTEVTERILAFRDERDWAQFHTPRNLAAAIAIEAAELQQALLWKSDTEVDDFLRTDKGKAEVGREIADTLIFTLKHSAGMKTIQIAEKIYPHKFSELTAPDLDDLVRGSLKRVRKALRAAEILPPRNGRA